MIDIKLWNYLPAIKPDSCNDAVVLEEKCPICPLAFALATIIELAFCPLIWSSAICSPLAPS